MVSLLSPDTPIKVSSTLEKAGKKHLIDGSPETCWTSQQGLPQYIQVTFPDRVVPESIHLTFQGGFVGTRCAVKISKQEGDGYELLTHIFPEDTNKRQEFLLPATSDGGIQKMRLEFEESSDFFGRITVYDLKLFGTHV
ncbi:Malic enzyme [Mycena indigotica]|uniref:Malic enzyme n=1 Tax=Mycena indigotica TaxID=2126181 RepID=A0A8H6SVZ5_9AGAR|nr:Malic enzyme [Mycena indigotica]KAF7307235.1 Malic enzyme [Mycena indigotica]